MDIQALVKASPPIPTEFERENYSTGGEKLSKLVKETTETLLDAVASGVHLETAAKSVGLHPKTVRRWISRAEEDIEANRSSEYVTFLAELYKAESLIESSAVASWSRYFEGEQGDWRAIATYLERRFPDRWGKKSEVHHSGQVVHGVVMLPQILPPTVDYIQIEVKENE